MKDIFIAWCRKKEAEKAQMVGGENREKNVSININQPQLLKFTLAINKGANSCRQTHTTCCQPQVVLKTVACWQPPARQLGFY